MKRGGPLRRRSKKRAQYYREVRIPLVIRLLEERPLCEAGPHVCKADTGHSCRGRTVDVHERKRRSQGGSLEDPINLMAVCRACHDWIGDNVALSYELGLLVRSWDDPQPLV